MEWLQIKKLWLFNQSQRGRKPKWFKKIEEVAINGNQRQVAQQYQLDPSEVLLPYKQLKPDRKRTKLEWVKWHGLSGWRYGKISNKHPKTAEVSIYYIEEIEHNGRRIVGLNISTPERRVKVNLSDLHVITIRRVIVNAKIIVEMITPLHIANTNFIVSSINRQEFNNHMRLSRNSSIFLESLSDTYINKWVDDDALRDKMLDMKRQLEEKDCSETLRFFTDGSLQETANGEKRMASATIEIQSELSLSATIDKWPSSTRPEINAILLSLLVTPEKRKIEIHCDSQAAIDAVNFITDENQKIRVRQLLKMKNRSLLIKCQLLCKIKDIDMKLIKVKGHSGNEWNDKVDILAKKEAISNNYRFNQDHKEAGPILYYPRIKNEGIETNIRGEIKRLNDLSNQYEWSFINEIRRKIELDCDWDISWELFRRMKGKHCRSMGISACWNWCFKSFHNLLPTTKWLKIRKPDLYKNAKCPLCYSEEESTKHFVECTKLQHEWIQLQEEMSREITQSLEKLIKKGISTISRLQAEDLKDHVIELLFKNTGPKTHVEQWITCSMDTRFDDILKQFVHNRETRIDLLTVFLEIFIKLFRKRIWNLRCEKFVEWEKDHNINQKKKKERKTKLQSRNNNSQQNPELIYDDEDFTELNVDTQPRSQKNRTREFYTKEKRVKFAITKIDFWYPELISRNYKENWVFVKKRRKDSALEEEARKTTLQHERETRNTPRRENEQQIE
jgi:ribonuclease HI